MGRRTSQQLLRRVGVLVIASGLVVAAAACQRSGNPETVFDGRSAEDWRLLLLDPEEERREWAFDALVSGGADAAPILVAQLGSRESWSHHLARRALVEIGADAIPALEESVQSDSPRRAQWALAVLAQMGADAASTAPVVAERYHQAMRDNDSGLVAESQRALYEMGPAAIPALIPLLDDDTMHSRVFALLQHWEAHSLPTLELLKEHSDLEVREHAMRTTAAIHSYNGRFDDNLRVWQRNRERSRPGNVRDIITSRPDSLDHRLASEIGILNLTIPQALARIEEMLGSESDIDRRRAARALTGFGARSTEMLPLLVISLESGHMHFNWEVMRSLASIGPDAAPAIPFLVQTLKHSEDPNGQRFAAHCLASIGLPAPGAEAELIDMIRTRSTEVFEYTEWQETRRAAIYALARVNPEVAIPVLIETLDDPSWSIQKDAIDALVLIGPRAVEPLHAALDDQPRRARRNAACVLMRIGRDSLNGWVALEGIDPHDDPMMLWAKARSHSVLGG